MITGGSGDEQKDGRQPVESMLKEKVLSSKSTKTDPISRSTRLLEKRKEQLEVQQALDDRKLESKKAEDAMKKREEDLRKREKELQEELVKYHKFLNDNDAKRVEAERKLVENKKFLDQKDEDIRNLKQYLEQIKRDHEDKKRMLDAHRKYAKFFKQVLEHTDEYKEVKSLIERFNTLSGTKTRLQQAQEQSARESEIEKTSLQKYVEERVNEVLALNNEISNLQKTLETMSELTLKQETSLDERSGMMAMRVQEFTQVKMACDNLYRRMLERAGQKYKKVDIVTQIEVINELLADYKDIVKKEGKLPKKLAAALDKSSGAQQPPAAAV